MSEIEIDAGEGVFDPDSGNGGDHEVACLEHALHHGKGAFHQGSRSTDGFVPPLTPDPRMDHGEMIQLLTQAGYVVQKLNAA